MNPTHSFHQGPPHVAPRRQMHQPYDQTRQPPNLSRGNTADSDDQRIAHTLTACCRCRLRKTRCDPTLPRCLPCERSGSVCEYLDTTKGRKINRYYVILLQERVKALEAELGPYIDMENEDPRADDKLPVVDMVRLSASEGTTRFLGPSSGIVMTRLLVDEAKRFSEANRISDLIPELRARRQARMQSIQMTGSASSRAMRKKSYPMMSEGPAESLPDRSAADRLVDVYLRKDHLFSPAVHAPTLKQDLAAVYDGDGDPYKNFLVRMVIAISLQKLHVDYAGLADGYYLAAMQHFEDVVRAKDLKTLQCLLLTGQYSFLAPTRSSVYFIVGLATKICQRLGYTSEIAVKNSGYNVDPLLVDMRRRLAWLVIAMEHELAYSMGRPSGYASGHDLLDLEFFSTRSDDLITKDGIGEGPDNIQKLMSIHMCKMSLLQAEIGRTLYGKKAQDPKNDAHPWYKAIEKKMGDWYSERPNGPEWCNAWVTGWFHQLKIFLYRPSPQVPRPSPTAAKTCYESSAHVLRLLHKQAENAVVDISWLFLLSLTTALNTLLWTTSFPEVRATHSQESVEELIDQALQVLEQSTERWPGAAKSSELYPVFVKACLQSYNARANTGPRVGWSVPPVINEPSQSPELDSHSGSPALNPPQFGSVFNSPPEAMNNYAFDPSFPPQPTFRSNSIFQAPATTDSTGRRFSYFPPELTQQDDFSIPSNVLSSGISGNELQQVQQEHQMMQQQQQQQQADPFYHNRQQRDDTQRQAPGLYVPQASQGLDEISSPPESLATGAMSATSSNPALSPNIMTSQVQQQMGDAHNHQTYPMQGAAALPPKPFGQVPPAPNYTMQPTAPGAIQQRPLPSTDDWYASTAPFVSSDGLAGMTNTFFGNGINDDVSVFGDYSFGGGMGMHHVNATMPPQLPNGQPDIMTGRQGSLSHQQQAELINVLNTDGMNDLDTMLSAGNLDIKWM